MAGLLEFQNSPGWRKEMPKKYRYYRFIVRIKADLTLGDLIGIRRAIWKELHDVPKPDIRADKINKPSNLKWGPGYGT